MAEDPGVIGKYRLIEEVGRGGMGVVFRATQVDLGRAVAVKMILDHMTDAMSDGDRIEIRGFGSFSLHYRKARFGRNPKTGVEIPIARRRVVVFRPSRMLKVQINSSAATDEG